MHTYTSFPCPGVPNPDAEGNPVPEPAILAPVRYDHPFTNPRITTMSFPITDTEVATYLQQQQSTVKDATPPRDTTTSDADTSPRVPLSFAIIDLNNRQHKISAGDLLMIDRIDVGVGVSIVLHKVMLVGTQTYTIVGRPTIPNAEVSAQHGAMKHSTCDANVRHVMREPMRG